MTQILQFVEKIFKMSIINTFLNYEENINIMDEPIEEYQ